MAEQPRLDFGADEPKGSSLHARHDETPDERARRIAVDPRRNVALVASAGTGKTRVLVDRYVGLLEAGVAPRNILAITFTRKAAAEMRQRAMATLRERQRLGAIPEARWRQIRDAFGDIAISTIDAFCLALLHEFPLEAGVDPGFDLADETETPRFTEASLDRALRIGRGLSVDDSDVALLFTELGEPRIRKGLAALLDRRLVAGDALNGFLRGKEMSVAVACARLLDSLRFALSPIAPTFKTSGPDDPAFALIVRDVNRITGGAGGSKDPPLRTTEPSPAQLRGALDRLADLVLTQKGEHASGRSTHEPGSGRRPTTTGTRPSSWASDHTSNPHSTPSGATSTSCSPAVCGGSSRSRRRSTAGRSTSTASSIFRTCSSGR